MRPYIHNAISILLLICSKSQPDDDPIELKHTAVWILYKVVFKGYLFTPYFKKNSVVYTENGVVQADYKYVSDMS